MHALFFSPLCTNETDSRKKKKKKTRVLNTTPVGVASKEKQGEERTQFGERKWDR